ncbi:Chromosome partition protein Smc [Georgfuchsia toluolica]|uniref:Chromosome partition protein Smc n=1 Tax=Georgfuchsia toluolica TaxID=424218 RepID=A0A916J3B2_9PROT|nr:chromosome segregation protein SMC [Georgfuchsia toluolica]CAG4883822.1 Chromosome partition protein Smc [Georgfuchsia toluolica]
MRLTKLKLAGFKSFVDPTSVVFPGQLAGVVGPNGCGKSNIIDAVRWVLGESKASELRGESIQDVIFKGSGTRKEVSRASVELHFDNSLGRATGQWSQYGEIVVKRLLDREGNSSYYLNNLHVRRRDVIDLFLGTGLGPRAYAIIGQGMISRIVEAKPDELRMFLEEAAGVTKYKERRRETENRLEDARENLARVDDIRNELDGQIHRLQAQAEVAQRYRDAQAQLAQRQNLLWLKKRNDARRDVQRISTDIDKMVLRVDEESAQLRETEAGLEHAREVHFAASDALHAEQAQMYAANAEVGRLETEIAHMHDSRARLEQRLAQLGGEDEHWRAQLAQLEQERDRWQSLQENAQTRVATAAARHEAEAQHLPEAEQALQAAVAEVTAARRQQSEAEQGARLADADRGHAQRALENLNARRIKLEQEKSALIAPDAALLAAAQERHTTAQEELTRQQTALSALQGRIPTLEAELRTARERLQVAHRAATEARARRDALQQLQQRVRQTGDIGEWLRGKGLADASPLWKSIQVDAGWETAVEAILRERLAALSADVATAASALNAPPPVIFALALAEAGDAVQTPVAGSLRAKVRCSDAALATVLDEWLAGIRAVEDLSAVTPAAGAACVSREGHVRTRHGLTLYVPDAKTHGVIERQREIEELGQLIEGREAEESVAREAQQATERALNEAQGELAQLRRSGQEAQQRAHEAQVEALKLTQELARHEERMAQIEHDLEEVLRQEEAERTSQMRAEEGGSQWQEQIAAILERVDAALELQRNAEQALKELRALEQQLAREAQEAGFSQRECVTKLEDNAKNSDTARGQITRIDAARQSAAQELAAISDSVLQDQLQSALAAKQGQEAALVERREALETAALALRTLDEQRQRLEQSIEPLREKINDLKLKQQAAQLNEEQYQQRLLEANASEEALVAELQPGLKESVLQGDIARLNSEIEALGPVNLAALEELASSTQRKEYLDSQSTDLAQAIGTLEDAIRRIDRETREQLQETYDSVNRHFGDLFPQLFGGGEARLILTGDEILDAGIQIMAQPPGKKNSTIHLLSGGEKALTAIAMVFAIFQLNPAPFCLLDEVDAPLDDSNTDRFCEMVKRMSAQTQFIFITHNKIAMEMAQQLIGVTMQERGVSRVVEVDMDEALRMTEDMAA